MFYRAYLLSVIVEKSKKCVDFTFTLYFLHIINCTYYSQVIRRLFQTHAPFFPS
ncbi:hypothetical protein EON65_01930 [archaeon]|nr:MAG: hypothetical protein EON65_01930 [archaeon]